MIASKLFEEVLYFIDYNCVHKKDIYNKKISKIRNIICYFDGLQGYSKHYQNQVLFSCDAPLRRVSAKCGGT